MFKNLVMLCFLCIPGMSLAQPIVNVYAWTGEIPDQVLRQFENETGIKVNFSTYENNEIMYAKLRTSRQPGYDVVMPSSYFVDRMRKQNLLLRIDHTKLSNFQNLDPNFTRATYDPGAQFSIPFLWGVTGLFYNQNYFTEKQLSNWNDLWNPDFKNQLLLLDDSREVFSMALISLGYSANDHDPAHIKAAFLKLKRLMPNVKVFSSDTVVSILIDEDSTAGMAWNGDVYKASRENAHVHFIFPKEGFVVWVDNFAIPKSAPHPEAAYQFINFMLRPDIAKKVALSTGYPITNQAGKNLLPASIQNNPYMYPPKSVMQHGQFQTDLGDATLSLYEQYWEELKMGG